MGCNFKGSGAWNEGLVLNSVLDGAETITDGVLGLSNAVVIWPLDEDGAGEWVLDTLDEGVLVLSESLLIDEFSKACLLYTSPSPRDRTRSRMPSSA